MKRAVKYDFCEVFGKWKSNWNFFGILLFPSGLQVRWIETSPDQCYPLHHRFCVATCMLRTLKCFLRVFNLWLEYRSDTGQVRECFFNAYCPKQQPTRERGKVCSCLGLITFFMHSADRSILKLHSIHSNHSFIHLNSTSFMI